MQPKMTTVSAKSPTYQTQLNKRSFLFPGSICGVYSVPSTMPALGDLAVNNREKILSHLRRRQRNKVRVVEDKVDASGLLYQRTTN